MQGKLNYAPINVKPAGGEAEHRAGFWPGGRAFEFSCCHGGRDI